MRQEYVQELFGILSNSPLYFTLSVKERYGLVLRLIKDYPILSGHGDTNLRGSLKQEDNRTVTN
jgi:hypothetical protein